MIIISIEKKVGIYLFRLDRYIERINGNNNNEKKSKAKQTKCASIPFSATRQKKTIVSSSIS